MVDDYDGRIALLGVTNEEVSSPHGNNQVVFLKSNRNYSTLSCLHKIPTHELCEAKHGNPFYSDAAKLAILYPYREDRIKEKVRVNGHIVEFYKLTKWNDILFPRKEEEEYRQLICEVTSLAKDRLVMPERRKVLRFIHAMFRDAYYEVTETKWDRKGEIRKIPVVPDMPCNLFLIGARKYTKGEDGKQIELEIGKRVDHEIGSRIETRFGLEQLGVVHGISSHKFRIPREAKDAFYRKYPHGYRTADELTLRRFCDMIYDLVRIRHNFLPLR